MDVLEEKQIPAENPENNEDKSLKPSLDVKQDFDEKQHMSNKVDLVYLKPENFLDATSDNVKSEVKSIDLGIDYLVNQPCATMNTVNRLDGTSDPTALKTTEDTRRFLGMNQPQETPKPSGRKGQNGRKTKGGRGKNNLYNSFHLCEICGTPFDQQANLKKHQEAVHNIIKYVNCNKCDKVFTCMKDLEQHWKGTGICRKCKQNFYYPCVLIRHKCAGGGGSGSSSSSSRQSSSSCKNTSTFPVAGPCDTNTAAQRPKTTHVSNEAAENTEMNRQRQPMPEPLVCEDKNKAPMASYIPETNAFPWTVQNKPKHPCKECGVEFEKLTDLTKHQERVREMEGIPRCPKCYKFFNNMNEAHLHQVGSGFCMKCGKDMELPCMLSQHTCTLGIVPSIARATAGVISMVNVVCTICSLRFQSQESYVAHLRSDHNVNTDELLCKECGIIFSKKADLTAHEEMFHNSEIYRCYKCLKIFRERYKLYVHQQGSGICVLCGEDLEMPCMLIRHICKVNAKEQLARLQNPEQTQNNATVQGMVPDNSDYVSTTCSLCKTKFPNHAIYLAHVRMYHCLNTQELLCNLCGTVLSNKANLRTHHQLVHEMQGVLRCPKCNRAFRSREDMLAHVQQGSGVCTKCGKDFTLSCMLKVHLCEANNVESNNVNLL